MSFDLDVLEECTFGIEGGEPNSDDGVEEDVNLPNNGLGFGVFAELEPPNKEPPKEGVDIEPSSGEEDDVAPNSELGFVSFVGVDVPNGELP